MLHPGLSAHCAARDSGSLSQPSIKCRVIYCSASTTAVTARATHAAGPRESLWTSPDWYSWDRNHTCSPAACVSCNAPTSFQGLVVHCFPGTRLRWVKSLINLARSTVSVLNKGCQLCQMWWVLYELFFFTRSTDLEKVLNYLQRLKATLLFCIETAAETDPCLWDFNFSSCMSNFRKYTLGLTLILTEEKAETGASSWEERWNSATQSRMSGGYSTLFSWKGCHSWVKMLLVPPLPCPSSPTPYWIEGKPELPLHHLHGPDPPLPWAYDICSGWGKRKMAGAGTGWSLWPLLSQAILSLPFSFSHKHPFA